MTKLLYPVFGLFLAATGCSSTEVTQFRNALTGEECIPSDDVQTPNDPPKRDKKYCIGKNNNGHGNNEDGVDSSNPGRGHGGPNGETDESCNGVGDCIDDEIKHGKSSHKNDDCELPVGCDESMCCENPDDPGSDDPGSDDPGSDDPGSDDPGSDDPGSDDPGSDDPGSDDPGSDDPGSDDPGSDDPGSDDPEPPAPVCSNTCSSDADCGSERACQDNCCVIAID